VCIGRTSRLRVVPHEFLFGAQPQLAFLRLSLSLVTKAMPLG
jgi:hypothetical protein